MASQVFISHAGADSTQASAIALTLEKTGIHTQLDKQMLQLGDRFLQFMEKALVECDYCLLLWSKAASEREWVQLEWEAALYRTVKEARRFLIVARLENHPLPALLAPRLFVEFFPRLNPGIDKFISLCQEDQAAAINSGRPVGQATAVVNEDREGETIYITSELFQLTIPLRVKLEAPVGVFVDQLISDLMLPRQHDYQGLVGIRYEYKLVHESRRLVREKSFNSQGIGVNSILYLEVDVTPFAARPPVQGTLVSATFRGEPKAEEVAMKEARRALLRAVSKAGLGY
ncbi:MAG TPA: toll/interleukin-1 receptor domain-containing protein [Blastocatellia bacterium]|nr:toll/interleukin-1 receptor domain-containing protein [Blastocatellia bacterium]